MSFEDLLNDNLNILGDRVVEYQKEVDRLPEIQPWEQKTATELSSASIPNNETYEDIGRGGLRFANQFNSTAARRFIIPRKTPSGRFPWIGLVDSTIDIKNRQSTALFINTAGGFDATHAHVDKLLFRDLPETELDFYTSFLNPATGAFEIRLNNADGVVTKSGTLSNNAKYIGNKAFYDPSTDRFEDATRSDGPGTLSVGAGTDDDTVPVPVGLGVSVDLQREDRLKTSSSSGIGGTLINFSIENTATSQFETFRISLTATINRTYDYTAGWNEEIDYLLFGHNFGVFMTNRSGSCIETVDQTIDSTPVNNPSDNSADLQEAPGSSTRVTGSAFVNTRTLRRTVVRTTRFDSQGTQGGLRVIGRDEQTDIAGVSNRFPQPAAGFSALCEIANGTIAPGSIVDFTVLDSPVVQELLPEIITETLVDQEQIVSFTDLGSGVPDGSGSTLQQVLDIAAANNWEVFDQIGVDPNWTFDRYQLSLTGFVDQPITDPILYTYFLNPLLGVLQFCAVVTPGGERYLGVITASNKGQDFELTQAAPIPPSTARITDITVQIDADPAHTVAWSGFEYIDEIPMNQVRVYLVDTPAAIGATPDNSVIYPWNGPLEIAPEG